MESLFYEKFWCAARKTHPSWLKTKFILRDFANFPTPNEIFLLSILLSAFLTQRAFPGSLVFGFNSGPNWLLLRRQQSRFRSHSRLGIDDCKSLAEKLCALLVLCKFVLSI